MHRRDRIAQALSTEYKCYKFYGGSCPERGNPKDPKILIDALVQSMPEINPASWPERIAWGGIHINGKAATDLSRELSFPYMLEYFAPRRGLAVTKASFPKFSADWIHLENQDYAVVYKPAGLPSGRSREQHQISLYDYLTAHYQQKAHLPSRLDFSTAGLVLVGLDKAINPVLHKVYQQKLLQKVYVLSTARLNGAALAKFQEAGSGFQVFRAENYNGLDPFHPVLRKSYQSDLKEFKCRHAVTEFINLGFDPLTDRQILIALPLTGRTHQIRVHAACDLLAPIAGDPFYCDLTPEAAKLYSEEQPLALCSFALSCDYPQLGSPLSMVLAQSLWPQWLSSVAPALQDRLLQTVNILISKKNHSQT